MEEAELKIYCEDKRGNPSLPGMMAKLSEAMEKTDRDLENYLQSIFRMGHIDQNFIEQIYNYQSRVSELGYKIIDLHCINALFYHTICADIYDLIRSCLPENMLGSSTFRKNISDIHAIDTKIKGFRSDFEKRLKDKMLSIIDSALESIDIRSCVLNQALKQCKENQALCDLAPQRSDHFRGLVHSQTSLFLRQFFSKEVSLNKISETSVLNCLRVLNSTLTDTAQVYLKLQHQLSEMKGSYDNHEQFFGMCNRLYQIHNTIQTIYPEKHSILGKEHLKNH